MTISEDAFNANIAIVEALGLDPKTIRRNGVDIVLTDVGPIIKVEYIRRDTDHLVRTLKHYKLVPIEHQSGDEPKPFVTAKPTVRAQWAKRDEQAG